MCCYMPCQYEALVFFKWFSKTDEEELFFVQPRDLQQNRSWILVDREWQSHSCNVQCTSFRTNSRNKWTYFMFRWRGRGISGICCVAQLKISLPVSISAEMIIEDKGFVFWDFPRVYKMDWWVCSVSSGDRSQEYLIMQLQPTVQEFRKACPKEIQWRVQEQVSAVHHCHQWEMQLA